MQRRKNNVYFKPSNPYHGPVTTGVHQNNNNGIVKRVGSVFISRRIVFITLLVVFVCLGAGVWRIHVPWNLTQQDVSSSSSSYSSQRLFAKNNPALLIHKNYQDIINQDHEKSIPHDASNSNLRIRRSSKKDREGMKINDLHPNAQEIPNEMTKQKKLDVISQINHTNSHTDARYQSVKKMIQTISNQFYERYGGKESSRSMLAKGIKEALSSTATSTGSIASNVSATSTHLHSKSKHHTAERIILALHNDKRFVVSFGGYSVTVGRGNYYNQSYPFVMERILKPIFEELDLELTVRNSAIGGIPSFPYGWCLANFLGTDSDVVSWDYGMNEGNGADAFESYIRQSVSSLPKRPMMIMLDNKSSRMKMIEEYANNGILIDSIAVARGEVVEKKFLEMKEEDKPVGFRDWDTWGAPKGSPGQSNWHPKYKEHELIGWMIAMHFLDVIEEAIHMLEQDAVNINKENHTRLNILPKPISKVDINGGPDTPNHILYGIPLDNEDPESLWHMDPVSCRTSFLPTISGGLNEIIVSGVAENVGDDLQSRDDVQYQSGWVIDVGKVERDTKRKGLKYGGFGYIDMKNALYGIHQSGTLSLRIPHEGPTHDHSHDHESDLLASHWFDRIVICEVNEKRTSEECKLVQDLEFIVGGSKVDNIFQITNAAAYLKKDICINVVIPSDAVVKVTTNDEGDGSTPLIEKVELNIDISVKRQDVTREKGSCSISHVIWQSH